MGFIVHSPKFSAYCQLWLLLISAWEYYQALLLPPLPLCLSPLSHGYPLLSFPCLFLPSNVSSQPLLFIFVCPVWICLYVRLICPCTRPLYLAAPNPPSLSTLPSLFNLYQTVVQPSHLPYLYQAFSMDLSFEAADTCQTQLYLCRFKSHAEKSKPKQRIIEPCDEEKG